MYIVRISYLVKNLTADLLVTYDLYVSQKNTNIKYSKLMLKIFNVFYSQNKLIRTEF